MKIKSLNLLRYGHFQGRELRFSTDKFTIVYGPNEAGKSTSLAAIADLLYGFDRSCPYDFLHQMNQLRIGATLVNSAGDGLSFIRRKGNKDTVLAPDESPLPDSKLSPFLGQSSKDFFKKSFGLSHERLREGGDAISRADGDLGQILFEAGSGITSLAEVQKLLDKEADKIFAPRKAGDRSLYQSIDAYNAAHSALKEASLKRTDWIKAQTELADAIAALEDARKQLSQLSRRKDELIRWREVLVLLSNLDRLRNELLSLGGEAALPEDARDKFTKAVEQRRHGQDFVAETELRIKQTRKDLDELIIDDTLLAAGDVVNSLYESASAIEQQHSALPGLQANIASLKKQIASLVERFELPRQDDRPHLPTQTNISQLTALIADGQTLDREIQSSEAAEANASAEINRLRQDLESLGDAGDPRADIAVLQTLRSGVAGLPDERKLERDRRRHEKKMAEGVAGLSWWTKDVEALLLAKLPSVTQVEQHRKALDRTGKALDTAVEKLEEADADLAAAEHRLADYSKRETVYTDNDLDRARSTRQDAWQFVRQVLEGKPAPTQKQLAPFEAGDALGPVYEALVERADEIADVRFNSMEKIVEHNRLQRDVSEKKHIVELAKQKVNHARAAHEAQELEWQSLWASVGVTKPDHPEIMKDDLSIIAKIAEAAEALAETAEEMGALEFRVTELHKGLAALAKRHNVSINADDALDVTATRIQTALEKQSEIYTSSEALRARIGDQQRALDRTQKDLSTLRVSRERWQEKWQRCCSDVNLSGDTSVIQASEACKAWDEMRQMVRELDRTERERDKATALVTQFTNSAKSLQAEVGSQLSITSADDAIAAVRNHHKKLLIMQSRVTRRESIEKQLAEQTESLEKYKEITIRADGEIKALLELAGVSDEADLSPAIANAEDGRRLKTDIATAQQQLLQTSEGQSEDALRAGSAGLTREAIRDELESLGIESESAETVLEDAARRAEQARRAVTDLESKAGASSHVQALENAAARMEVQSRNYLRLQAASILLRHGIERIREKHKSPILTKGSQFFAELTTGSFQGLTTDLDKNDNPTIVGVRDDDQRVHVSGMSDGTRDQLYLALRLAFIENYCSKEEPLPFIADDLFVHFDEPRAKAGLKLLSQLPNCQVIMFTHHEHICQMATDVLRDDASILMLVPEAELVG